MRGFEANDCRLCNKTFCCPKCRLKHEINKHKIFPECNLCIYGQSECEDIVKETQLEHLEKTHLPLNCIYCRKVFASVEEIRQHRKCPVLQKRDDFPNTPFKEATIGEADEEAQDSPILQELQRKELLSYKFDLATSTPMPRIQEPVIFDKNRISDIQFDTEKSVPVVNKSIIRKTDSRVDSIKDEDHSSKRRVTFVETPGNIKNMDSGVREDKRDNTPDYSKEKTSCSPVTPATGIGSDQFYSAKSELEDFIPTRATGFSRHRPPAGGCTPLGVSFLSKVIPAKGNITASSDYHVSNKLEENHGVSTTPKNEDINTNEVDMDITCEHLPTSPIVYLENIEPRGDACKITTEASIVRNSNEKPTEIDRFDTANSEFNKVSSTPGFIRRRAPPLSERFAPEVPQIQSKTNAQANKNALSDAPNLSIQKTFSAATSKDGSLNTSGPIEVSMELECSWENRKFESIEKCLPLSSINSSKSPSFSPRTRISEQSEEGEANFSIHGLKDNAQCESSKYEDNNEQAHGTETGDDFFETLRLKRAGIYLNNTEDDENTPPNTKVQSQKINETLHAHAKSSKPKSLKNNEEFEFSKADQSNLPMDANKQINDISHKTLRLQSSGIPDHLNNTETDENIPPNIEVLREQNKETLHAPAKSLRPKSLKNNEEFEFFKADRPNLPMNANDQINDISLKTLRLKSSGIFHQLNITENNENTPPNINVLSEQNEETLHAPAKSLRPQLKHKSLRNNEEFEFSKADKSILPMDANKQLNDIFLNKTLRLKSSSILDQLNNTETDENTPPNIKVLSEQNEKTVHAPAKSIKPRLKHKSLKNNEEFDFTKADQPILPMDANKQINDISVKTLKSCGILDQPNNTETDENTPPNTKVLSDRNEETLHAPAKSLKPRSKNDEELEFSKADHYNPRDVKDQMIDISLKTLRLKSSGILDQLNKTDENTPPKTEVSTEKKEETLHASAESSRLSSNDCTYYHNTKETKISITTDSRAESSQQRATTSMPTAVFKKTDVCISFNFPNHFASTPIIHKTVKIKQINITDEISKIPKDLLSSKSNTLSLPNNYSSEETNECKDLAICDSKSENKKSSKGFVTVSSMTDLSLWTSMTRIFRTVFGGLHSRSKDVLDASSSNLNRDSFKRPLSESDSSPPHVKRFKFSDIKGRRPIREPFELPFRVALSRAPSSDRVATSGYARTVYEAGPRCKILWDRATQTDDYLMDGWQPQLK